ncbi:MAG TPA: hypothetical protein VLT33_24685 [Labilithrix sp.]|nr:hypothetical protein [Labilithrix sp.]
MASGGRLLDVAASETSALLPRLSEALAVRVRGAAPRSQVDAWAEGVRAARGAWVTDFGGAQFSVGRAWYTHLEQGRAAEYFAAVAESDATVARVCPGLQDAMRARVASVVGAPVVARPGWCGPGVHVFPAGALVAERGGDVHFDTEGLTPAHVAERAPALTLVLMLAPPASGGELRVWDVTYAGSDAYRDEDLERASVTCAYEAGDLLVIDSYRLHQIQPFTGARDRISATCHAAFVAGQWETWF